jgi:hypothetical protein
LNIFGGGKAMDLIRAIGSQLEFLRSVWFELFRVLLEIAAVVLGIRAYFDIRAQLDAASGLAANLASISKTLSTRFIGYFPLNFRKIMQVLKNAHKSVRIMVDYADYGSLTAHEDFLKYVALVNKLGSDPKVDVRMICYPFNEAKMRVNFDFGSEERLKGYKNEVAIKSLLRRKRVEKLPAPEAFIAWLLEDQVNTEKNFRQNGVQLAMYPHLPLFCWIRDDDEEAVFSFPFNESPEDYPGEVEPFRTSEISFVTRETKIVQTLSLTFDEIYAKATERSTASGDVGSA